MLAMSGTVVTRRVATTHKSESDRTHVRFSDLLMCADLRSMNRPNSSSLSCIRYLRFTAQHVCIVRTMPWQDVCPHICLSVRP